jgi:hypothetical protein
MSKDDEITRVVSQLDALLDALRANVDELTAILTPPDAKEPVTP